MIHVNVLVSDEFPLSGLDDIDFKLGLGLFLFS